MRYLTVRIYQNEQTKEKFHIIAQINMNYMVGKKEYACVVNISHFAISQ